MKKKKNYKSNYISELDLINLLLFEIGILEKKLNKENLTEKEKIFDNFIVSPSFVLKTMVKASYRKESGKNHV